MGHLSRTQVALRSIPANCQISEPPRILKYYGHLLESARWLHGQLRKLPKLIRELRGKEDYRRFLTYFLPLALHGISQSLTYPLVAIVASHGEGGAVNMAGLAQSQTVFGVFWTLAAGMTTAGMVFGRTREGFARCVHINNAITAGVTLIYIIFMIPSASRWLFGSFIGLTPVLEAPAIAAYVASLPLSVIFFIRNIYQIALFNNNPGYAFWASFARVGLNLLLAPLFCRWGAVGPVWAVVCMTICVILEMILLRHFSLPYLRRLPHASLSLPTHGEILIFTFTLSVGALFLSLSSFLMGAFIARAPRPEVMMPVFYLVMGILGPVSSGVSRLQALIIHYYGQSNRINRRLFRFSIMAGIVLGVIPLFFILPGIIEWYYVKVQRLSFNDLGMVRGTTWLAFFLPFVLALRSFSEGKAAWLKKPLVVLTGQAVYLSVAALTALFALMLKVPGNLLGILAMTLANLFAAGVVLHYLNWKYRDFSVLPAPAESGSSL